MRVALLSDIHANLEALEACLAHARERGADSHALLGDFMGSRTSLHVVESADPAATILSLANANHVDLIILGAPAPGERTLACWRSVASDVTAGAPCSVHVVRVPRRTEPGPEGA